MGTIINAQNLPVKKYASSAPLELELRSQKKWLNSFTFEGGFKTSTFLNGRFAEAIENEELSLAFGNYFSFGYTLNPLVFNISRASSRFLVSENFYLLPPSESRVFLNHISWEAAIGLHLFPYQKISKYLIPQLGIAYQMSRICTNCLNDENENYSSLDISSPAWYFNLVINLGKRYFFSTAFKQSFLNAIPSHKNQQLSFGIGKRLE